MGPSLVIGIELTVEINSLCQILCSELSHHFHVLLCEDKSYSGYGIIYVTLNRDLHVL